MISNTPKYDVTMPSGQKLFIPDNNFGICEGYYGWQDLVELFRTQKENSDAVQFIADMME